MKEEFWRLWKNKTPQEVKYIKALKNALSWIKKQPFIKDIEAIYVKGSFVSRELNKESDIDLVPIVKNRKALNLVRELRDKNKEWLKPVDILPMSIQELKTNKRHKKPLPGSLKGKPDHFTVLLPHHKLIYGNHLNTKNWKIRTEQEIYDDLKKADKFDKELEADLAVAKRVEMAWREVAEGKYKKMSSEDFLKEIRSLK